MIKKIIYWLRHLFSFMREISELQCQCYELERELERFARENDNLRHELNAQRQPRKPYKKRVKKSTAEDSQNESGRS